MKETKYLSLPENDEGYTLSDAINLICKSINPDPYKKLNTNSHKMIYQKIKRELKKQNCQSVKKSERKTTYEKNDILRVINGTSIYIDFYIEMSKENIEEIEEFNDNQDKYKKIAKKVSKIDAELKRKGIYDDMMQKISLHNNEPIFNEEEELDKLKIRCISKIILDLFEFDETTAKHDIPSLYTFEPDNPLVSDIESLERLKDVSNYYNKDLVELIKEELNTLRKDKERKEKLYQQK